ncbi:MAG: cytochrome c biogenesis protein CcsA [Ignavibacteriales bacterium]|nr:cytochrome c biogenesis protein CcsA [Ignavibacteriales bacterium]
MIGSIIIKIGFLSAIAAVFFYYRAHRNQKQQDILFGRFSFHAAVLSQMAACVIMLYLILTHQFQYTYVWNYSSTDLSLSLLISTFYAGQEGSFMLWALYTSIIGVFLLQYSSRKNYEPEVMAVYSLILTFLMTMLIFKNPFAYIWDTFPNDLVQTGPIPAGISNYVVLDAAKSIWARFPVEGKGLNPLLQNYWMVIHPQVLFIGFSSMAVPYALAVGALLKRDYHSWIRVATPWSVFGAMILGTGIILGGYWAYETLGWGGFWGWDPVENSSLVPWLICVASIHTALTQRQSGAFVRTNFVLSLLTFIMVLYSTFLTRSGILGETSVHSFVDPGMWVYWLLLIFITVFAVIGFGLLFARMREMPKIPVQHSIVSREFALFLGASALTFVAIFVVVGTSSPIITTIAKGKASAMDIAYYVKTNLPLGIAITFLSGIGQLLWWKSSTTRSILKKMAPALVLAVVASGIVLLLGYQNFFILLFVFCSAFSLFANLQVGYDIYMGNPKFVGGSIAHIGIAIMCLGFVTSERYDEKKTVALERGKPVDALGYTMTYVGYHPVEDRYAFAIDVEKGGMRRTVAPTMYYSEFTKGIMRHPDLINFINKDFYVAPLSLEEASSGSEQTLTLQKGEEAEVAGLKVSFLDYLFSNEQKAAMAESRAFSIDATMQVSEGARKKKLVLQMKGDKGEFEYPPSNYVAQDKRTFEFRIAKLIPDREDKDKSKIEITVKTSNDPNVKPKGETLVIEASIKPYINLVWVGTVTLVVGFLLTIFRRVAEARIKSQT